MRYFLKKSLEEKTEKLMILAHAIFFLVNFVKKHLGVLDGKFLIIYRREKTNKTRVPVPSQKDDYFCHRLCHYHLARIRPYTFHGRVSQFKGGAQNPSITFLQGTVGFS